MATHVLNKMRNSTWVIDRDDDAWIVGEKGRIAVTDKHGIYADDYIDSATVRIEGGINVDGSGVHGIYLASESARISLSAGAHISGSGSAAVFYSYNSGTTKIDNDGILSGFEYGIRTFTAQNGADIRNDGRIVAANYGIRCSGAGADIVNTGTIKSEQGIYANQGNSDSGELLAAYATHIVNSGKITGSDYSIRVGNVAVNIRNKDLLDGDVGMDNGHDALNNRGGVINGDIVGGWGNDVFNMAGGKLNGTLYGGEGDDVVMLSSLATVYVEYAGQGTDTVRINGSYQLGANIENLTLLGKGNHAGIGNSLDNTITGNKGGNALYGQAGDDQLDGEAGNDRLDGGDGDDRLGGGKGSDILAGGDGDDAFLFERGYGRDTITDFQDGFDWIHLFGFVDFDEIDDFIRQSGNDAVIDFGDGDMIVIRNMLMANLTSDDFVFT